MSKFTKLGILVYIVFALFSFLYIRDTLKKEKLSPKEDKKAKIEDIFQVTVSLSYSDGKSTTTYERKMRNVDTVEDLLTELRNKEGLVFEKTSYTYGTEIDEVNGIVPISNMKWAVIYEGKDITTNIGGTKLGKGDKFELKMIPK